MKCPHCAQGVQDNWSAISLVEHGPAKGWHLSMMKCPLCKKLTFMLHEEYGYNGKSQLRTFTAYPQGQVRPLPPEVPDPFAADFREACAVLPFSPKASAALSRRNLQHLLVEKGGASAKNNLDKQIDEVEPNLPSYLADVLDQIRHLGNFAAHPTKSTNTREILDVEPDEAEWCLDVLEGLFAFYFVQPVILKKKKAALNAKLKEAGKQEMP